MSSLRLPDTLWHYTDVNGLLGILQSRQFCASSATYLNDEQELDFGQLCLRKGLDRVAREKDRSVSGPVSEDTSLPGDSLRWQRAELEGTISLRVGRENTRAPEIYIVSFCENGDLLSQWQGYSGGAGFALGFDRYQLNQELTICNQNLRLEKVLYGEDGVKMFAEQIERRSAGDVLDKGQIAQLLQEVGRCKHAAFEAEQEWRIMIGDPEKTEVRTRSNALLPFVKVDFPISALKEVRIGPGGNRDLREKALKHALESNSLKVFEFDLAIFEDDELYISYMQNTKDASGEYKYSDQDITREITALEARKKSEISKAERNSDVKISRSKAPYRA